MRNMMCALLVATVVACGGSSETERGLAPKQLLAPVASPEVFAGSWRSVTAPVEFIRLTVSSTSVQQGLMAARMTFSGVAWEGTGRVDGDSLRLDMRMAGTSTSVASVVIRANDTQTIRLLSHPAVTSSQSALDLTLVRED